MQRRICWCLAWVPGWKKENCSDFVQVWFCALITNVHGACRRVRSIRALERGAGLTAPETRVLSIPWESTETSPLPRYVQRELLKSVFRGSSVFMARSVPDACRPSALPARSATLGRVQQPSTTAGKGGHVFLSRCHWKVD